MKCSSAIAVLTAAGAAFAAPAELSLKKRTVSDATILNYALTLEHLEATFYRLMLAKFSQDDFNSAGLTGDLRANLLETRSDEITHVNFLASALRSAGYPHVAACTYDFSNITSAKLFVETASILEGVGVTAYLGAAAEIVNKDYLTAAGSILTVEARHSSYIREALGLSPAPAPFDVPLDFDEVYTLAAPFIKTCPKSNPALPVKAFPALTSTATGPVSPGGKVTLTTNGFKIVPQKGGKLYAAWISVTGPIYVPVVANAASTSFTVEVPKTGNIGGQSYVVITGCRTGITDQTVAAGPAIVEVTSVFGKTA